MVEAPLASDIRGLVIETTPLIAQGEAADAPAVVKSKPTSPPEHADQSSERAEHQQEEQRTDAEDDEGDDEEEHVESVGGADALEEARMPRFRRQYKIQEVIKRRQVMLVQVVKEERGTKGAALTTYLSLAGRYSVLMPNTARGGGISRKITSADDRKRLKQIAQDLEVPEGMGVILRTAGANRTKAEVKRDFEYLMRMWETVRDLTLKSTAPKLVYEEGSLIKRSIRDLYNKDIDEVVVAGDEGYREAKDFMRMLMPSHAKNVKPYKDSQPLLARYGAEGQLDAMFSPTVQLRSGGYIVINQAEALVAIDVNSGRATREHHIEDTALKTNLEAAEEVSRQLRLRDLAGLIVIDFIDMDETRNNRAVERSLKECLKHDRARIQVGRISHFGLLEMSRQRIRTSVLESSTEKCPHCGGTGHVRSVSSVTLQLLRALEEALMKGATHSFIVRTRSDIALYVLNQKRSHLRELESRFEITITINADATINGQISRTWSSAASRCTASRPRGRLRRARRRPLLLPMLRLRSSTRKTSRSTPIPRLRARARSGRHQERALRRMLTQTPEKPGKARTARGGGGGGGGDAGRASSPSSRRQGCAGPSEAGEQSEEGADEGEPAEQGEPNEQTAEGDATNAALSEAERRRRRRGRRGGRRNRRDREGEPSTPPSPEVAGGWQEWAENPQADAVQPPAPPQQEVPSVAAYTPSPQEERAIEPRALEPQPEPVQPEAPKRRSTVREPVPFATASSPEAPPP